MVMRCKTVEYSFDTRTTQMNAATRHDFSAITVYIPETASRKFLSVAVQLYWRENEATGGTDMGTRTVGIKLGAAAFSDDAKAETVVSSFAPISFRTVRDVTSYFETNFGSGTSQTCQVGVQVNTLDTQTITAKLIITYEFDDAAASTRVKTVKIPLDSPTTKLTSTLTEIGTNQVPQLTGGGSPMLPEASVTIRDIWFEFGGTDNTITATDYNLAVSLDAEAEVSMGTWESGQVYSRTFFAIWKRADMSPSAAHAFKARATTTDRVNPFTILLCVTYEYNHDSTGTVLNSLELYLPRVAHRMSLSDTAAENYHSEIPVLVQEPGTITLKQSGVLIQYNSNTTNEHNILIRCGGQSYRTYAFGTDFAGTDTYGPHSHTHRFDSGGAQGTGMTLTRGDNTFFVDSYMSDTSSDAPFQVDAVCYLNYHSGKHENGVDSHAHTTRWVIKDMERTSGSTMIHTVGPLGPKIPDANYYIVNVGVSVDNFLSGSSGTVLMAERVVDEEDGWANLVLGEAYAAENFMTSPLIGITHLCRKHNRDPNTALMHIGRSRRWRVGMTHSTTTFFDTTVISSAMLTVTHAAMALEVERGVTPATANLAIDLHHGTTKERLYSTESRSNGLFSFLCHSDAVPLFGHTTSTTAGRSLNFTPSGFTFNDKWTPLGLANLGLWLRADKGVTQSGTVSAWTDQSGNANNASQGTSGNRPVYAADGGDGRPSITYDGTADLLEVTDSASIGSTTAFSVACWIKTGATFPTDGTIIAQWGATERFLMRVETGGNLVVSVSNGSAGTATLSAVLSASRNYHVGFTYDGAGSGNAGRLKVYLNGIQKSPTYAGTVPASTGNPTTILSIGSRNAAATYFNGSIDDIILVNGRALTEEEMLLHYWYRPRFG